MRQRNDTGQRLTVHTDPPQLVEPGGEVDHDTYLVGFTALDTDPAGDTAGDTATPAAKPARATAKEGAR